MRIEINAGGLGGAFAVLDYQSDMSGFIDRVDDVMAGFKAVHTKTCDLSGGVGSLSDALIHVDARIAVE